MNRRSLAVSIAFAICLSTVPALPSQTFAPGAVAEISSKGSMADQSNPRLVGFPQKANPYENFRLSWEGLSTEAKISSVSVLSDKGLVADSDYGNDIRLRTSAPYGVYGYLTNWVQSEDGVARAEFPLLIVYVDGSIDRVTQAAEIRPIEQKDAYQPYLRNHEFQGGETSVRQLSSLPAGSKLNLISAAEGWTARIAGPDSLEITAPQTDDNFRGHVSLEVTYPDGTIETLNIPLERNWEPIPQPPKPGKGDDSDGESSLLDKPGFDKTELDFSDEMSRRQTLRVVGLKKVPVQRIEVLDENGWGYQRGQIGILELDPIRGSYGDEPESNGFYVWAHDQESPDPVVVNVAVRVIYADGTTEDVKSPIRVKPYVPVKCELPEFDAASVKPGQKSIIKMTGLPADWPVLIENLNRGSAARITEGGDLEVLVPKEQDRLRLDLSFPCTGDRTRGMNYGTEIDMPWRESFPPRPLEPANPDDKPKAPATTTVTSTVPTTVVSTVNGTPTTVSKERVIISEVPVTEKTVVVEPGEPSQNDRTLTIVTVFLSLIAAIGGIAATLLNIPGVRAHLPF